MNALVVTNNIVIRPEVRFTPSNGAFIRKAKRDGDIIQYFLKQSKEANRP